MQLYAHSTALSFLPLNVYSKDLFPEEDGDSAPATGLKDPCKLPQCGFWDRTSGLLEKQQLLLTTGPSLQPRISIFKAFLYWF